LQEAFYRCVDKFISGDDEALQTLADGLPPTSWTLSECIVEVNRNVLLLVDVSYGRMVAIAAFLTEVSVRCVQNELSEAIVPLIDQAAVQVNEKLAQFILENRGLGCVSACVQVPEEARRLRPEGY
jgi:hypothetical protein